MASLLVTMSFLLLLAVALGLAVMGAYTGLLNRRFPELADRLGIVAKVLSGDEQMGSVRGR